jgi:release factor glutamine methyltransferase
MHSRRPRRESGLKPAARLWPAVMNIDQAIRKGEKILARHGVSDPRWNSERLMMLALHRSRTEIYSDLSRELSEQEIRSFEKLIDRRAKHHPLAYLEGTQEFFGREFLVNESVLIPRPETEGIVQAVLDLPLDQPNILDIASGSGVIAVTLSLEIPGSHVFALELSSAALPVLRKNAEECVSVVRGNFQTLPFISGSFDVVTANLPYVEPEEFANLPAETKWEPRMALLTESLEDTYCTVVRQSARILRPRGHLVLEIGYGQSERLRRIIASEELNIDEIRTDQQNIPRVMILKK